MLGSDSDAPHNWPISSGCGCEQTREAAVGSGSRLVASTALPGPRDCRRLIVLEWIRRGKAKEGSEEMIWAQQWAMGNGRCQTVKKSRTTSLAGNGGVWRVVVWCLCGCVMQLAGLCLRMWASPDFVRGWHCSRLPLSALPAEETKQSVERIRQDRIVDQFLGTRRTVPGNRRHHHHHHHRRR